MNTKNLVPKEKVKYFHFSMKNKIKIANNLRNQFKNKDTDNLYILKKS